MSVSNGIITAPVSIKDVQEAMRETSNDLATLCKSSNINMWSKYKPVHNTLKFVKDTVNADKSTWTEATDGKGWWLGEIDRGGRESRAIYFPMVTTKAEFKTSATAPQYVKPSGGETSPYRLTDFVGYYDDAVPPMVVLVGTQNEIGKEWSCNIQVVDPDDYSEWDADYDPKYCYTWSDILDMLQVERVYPAVLVVNKTKKMQYFYVGHSPIAIGDNVVKFTLGDGSPYSDGGMGFVSNVGDVLEFYVCATDYDDSEVYDNFMNSYRLSGVVSFASLTMTGKTYTNKNFIVHGADFDYTVDTFSGTRYVKTSDDDVVSGSKLLKLNAGGVTWKGTENDTSGITITGGYIWVYINIIGSDDAETSSTYLSTRYALPVNPSSDKVYSLKDFTSNVYLSQEDAEMGNNPVPTEGIIIPDTVVYGSAMYDGKVKKVQVRVGVSLNFTSENYRVMQVYQDDVIYEETF